MDRNSQINLLMIRGYLLITIPFIQDAQRKAELDEDLAEIESILKDMNLAELFRELARRVGNE